MEQNDFVVVDSNNVVIAMSADNKVMTKLGYRFVEKEDSTPFVLQDQNGVLVLKE